MATKSTNTPATSQASPIADSNSTPSELVVRLYPFHWDFHEFHGTREMLEREGVIPKGTEWPEGYFDLIWKDEQFEYWLRRIRPDGAKGSRKQFRSFDWFCLRFTVINGPSSNKRRVIQKEKELKELTYRSTAKGQSEWYAHGKRLLAAYDDKQFQAFKAKIPGLVPAKRGRKNTAQEAQ